MLGRKAKDGLYVPVTIKDPRSPMAESFRTLRTNINFSAVDRELKMLLVTSPHMGEGKSTASANLAVVMAQAGQETLLVDCDLRKPVLHKFFDLPNGQGLTNLLSEDLPLEKLVQPTVQDKLKVLTSGPIPPNPAEMLGSRRMERFLKELRSRYDRIIIDTAPVEAVTDALVLSSQVDGVLLVIDAGKTPVQMAQDAREKLARANAYLVGVILNKVKREANGYYYYYYYSYGKTKD